MKKFALIGAGGYIAPRHLRAIKDTGSLEELSQKTQELGAAMQAIGEAVYQQPDGTAPGAGGPGGGPEDGGSPPPDEDVIDGEFSEA